MSQIKPTCLRLFGGIWGDNKSTFFFFIAANLQQTLIKLFMFIFVLRLLLYQSSKQRVLIKMNRLSSNNTELKLRNMNVYLANYLTCNTNLRGKRKSLPVLVNLFVLNSLTIQIQQIVSPVNTPTSSAVTAGVSWDFILTEHNICKR